MHSFSAIATVDKLTAYQLREAAHDLRNAALVVYYAGHAKGALVARKTGAVCAVGAIQLATKDKLLADEVYHGAPVYWHSVVSPASLVSGELWNRAEGAILVLAANVPTDLCADCTSLYDGDPWQTVTHYNDFHCRSGTILYRLLREAAEQADALSHRRALQVA